MAGAEIIATYTGGGTLWNPGVEVQPDDAVIWFLRLNENDSEPSGSVRSSPADSGGTPITFDYAARANWGDSASTNYISYIDGEFAFDGAGAETVVSDYIYVMFDQFQNFTAGNHYIKFTIPGVSRARVEAAHLLRGVIPETPGAYTYFADPSPNQKITYASPGTVAVNGFPVSVSLTADSSIVYCLYDMSGTLEATTVTAGYNSVSGTQIKAYTYTDPSTSPSTMTQSIIAYIDGLTGVGTSISAPDENGLAAGADYTTYTMDTIVINGGAGAAVVPPTVYFLDAIVFNAVAGGAPVEF